LLLVCSIPLGILSSKSSIKDEILNQNVGIVYHGLSM